MASCNTVTLLSDACLSGFLNQSQRNALAIKLQLVNDASGNTLSIDDLIDQACDNGFMSQSRNSALAIEIQLWCNLTGSTPACTNILADGLTYNPAGTRNLADFLAHNSSFQVTFRANDTRVNYFDQNGVNQNIFAPGVYQISTGASGVLVLYGVDDALVTTEICQTS